MPDEHSIATGRDSGVGSATVSSARVAAGARLWGLIRLSRPVQWAKGIFVLLGPLYAIINPTPGREVETVWSLLWPALIAFVIFGLVSSGCYIVNDVADAERDRQHPRKRRRPVASGLISPFLGLAWAGCLFVAAVALFVVLPWSAIPWLAACVSVYAVNVVFYTFMFKGHAIADVVSLSMGFVLRVLGGCAAAQIVPSTWLLNSTLFIAMFLAFGKRLGERRSAAASGGSAEAVRPVLRSYTDDLLRMAVVVTAVASLVTYAGYVQAQGVVYEVSGGFGMNVLWLSMVPATYGLLRCMVLLEMGTFDDPTELAVRDRPFQGSVMLFVAMTLWAVWLGRGQIVLLGG